MDKLERLQRTLARKTHDFWANVRTTRRLFERSKYCTGELQSTLDDQIAAILDQGNLIYPPLLEELGFALDTPLQEKKSVLEIPPCFIPSQRVRKFREYLLDKAVATRKQNWVWRVQQEFTELAAENWHPFFVTLTVDRNAMDPEQLWREGRAFRRYIRKLSKVSAQSMGHRAPHKKPYRPESDYVRYCGVVEHGKSRKHHHGHFLIWMRAIPPKWRSCPNRGISDPARRINNECIPMRRYWKWSLPGLSPALYFRSVGDIWKTKYNFAMPVNERTGKAMNIGGPQVAGLYVAKYMSKEFREWKHRTKATRNLGLTRLKSVIRNLSDAQVEALTWRAETYAHHLSLTMTVSVPIGLIRSTAKQETFYRKYRSNRLSETDLLQSNTETFIRMQRSVNAGARPDRMPSGEFFDWVSQHLPENKEFCEQRLDDAYKQLAGSFPPLTIHKTNPLGGMQHGFT